MTITIRYRILADKSRSAYLDIYDQGIRRYHPTNVRIYPRDPQRSVKMEMIDLIRQQVEREMYYAAHGVKYNTVKLFDYMEQRIDAINNTCDRQYRCMMAIVRDVLPNDILIRDVRYSDCQKIIDHMYTLYTRNSVNLYYSKLSRIMNDAVRDQLISINPCREISKKPRLNMQVKNVILIDDFRKLINTPCDRADKIRDAVILSYYTGMGYNDVINALPTDIINNTVHYKRSKTKIPVSVRVHPDILSRISLPVSLPRRYNVNKILAHWCEEAKIRPVTFYCLRHSFAVNLLLSGINIEKVRLLMGHTTLAQTQVYLKYIANMSSDEDVRLPLI